MYSVDAKARNNQNCLLIIRRAVDTNEHGSPSPSPSPVHLASTHYELQTEATLFVRKSRDLVLLSTFGKYNLLMLRKDHAGYQG